MPACLLPWEEKPCINEDFQEKHKEIIDKEKVTPRNDIENELKEVLDVLDEDYKFKEELNSKYRSQFENDFNKLSQKLTKATAISVIRGVSDEASILRDKCIKKIDEFKLSQGTSTGGEVIEPPKTKSIDLSMKFIASQSKVKIENEEDLEMFLNIIKSEVKKRLDDDEIDFVNIRL